MMDKIGTGMIDEGGGWKAGRLTEVLVDRPGCAQAWLCGYAGNNSNGESLRVLYHLRCRKRLFASSKHQVGGTPRGDVVALRRSGENRKEG